MTSIILPSEAPKILLPIKLEHTHFLARRDAVKLSREHNATSWKPHQLHNKRVALIAINSPEDGHSEVASSLWTDVLQLLFDDVDPNKDNVTRYTLFNEQLADQILDFLLKHERDVDAVWVHCYAGISRSAAVASVISSIYRAQGYPLQYSLHNRFVRSLLMQRWNIKLAADPLQTPGVHKD